MTYKTPLLLIPGMMCDARLFSPQIAQFSGTRAIQIAPISEFDNVEALAAGILSSAPDRFALAGLSMGGIVAMEVLRQASNRVERIALLDTNPRAELDLIKERRGPQMDAVRAGKLEQIMCEQMIPNYTHDGVDTPEIDALCLRMALDLGPKVFLRQSLALMKRPAQMDTLATYQGPASVLVGESDKLCPLDRHTQMAGLLPNAQLNIIPGAGHLTTLEQPDLTNAVLTRWLEAT
ncbi:alpha/beta fold hydrolase [Cochlodiniinecator piscidefendens]|uniref:alpha/beta fold hydrolase n=1 Tax=Cochlodiniinecator piscidefendens TaxID=2715756 RepID=UPI00140DE763|nr:alpha/beta hydrolase [Cochlodiniinecator piscidefendens]